MSARAILDQLRLSKLVEGGPPGGTQTSSRLGIRGIGMSVTKMEVGRDVTGGLGSKSKKWELVVGDT